MNRGAFRNTTDWVSRRYSLTLPKILSVLAMIIFLLLTLFFMNVGANIASFWTPVKAYNTPLQDLLCDFFNVTAYTEAYVDTVDVLLIVFVALSAVIIVLNRLAVYIGLKLMFCISISYLLRFTTVVVTSVPDPWNMSRRTIFNFYTEAQRDRGGDLVFSGHTLLVASVAHAWSSFYLITDSYILHCITAALAWAWAVLIMIFLLVGRLHYTIDVLIGLYIASGVWWTTSYFATRFFEDPVCKLRFRSSSPRPMLSTSVD